MVEIRYRLRQGTKVVGYMRKWSDQQSVFYSKDSFWWTGRPLTYDAIDEWTGLRDVGNTPVYEWDIVAFRPTPEMDEVMAAVLWHKEEEQFALVEPIEGKIIPLAVHGVPVVGPRDLRVHAYLFQNPGWMEQLGLEE
jgi:hypothetical protein